MKKLSVTEFRKQCLALLDDLPENGVLILKRGKPIAQLNPLRANDSNLIGLLKGNLTARDNVFSTNMKWDAES